MRLMLATVALAALTLGLSSLVHSGAERVTASLNDVAAVSSSR